MSVKFPGDWVRGPRLGHVKAGIRRALDVEVDVPMTTTELLEWTHALALHQEKNPSSPQPPAPAAPAVSRRIVDFEFALAAEPADNVDFPAHLGSAAADMLE
jgi:hypothetical protein